VEAKDRVFLSAMFEIFSEKIEKNQTISNIKILHRVIDMIFQEF
jgi:hypothetical protein